MIFLLKHVRKIIYGGSILWAMWVFAHVSSQFPLRDTQALEFTVWFSWTAVVLLYLTLLYSPLYSLFPKMPGKPVWLLARRALGVSAFLFACVHAFYAFFKTLGGFSGLGFLSGRYIFSLVLSLTALLILFLLAVTSFDRIIVAMGKWWNWLHRFLYLAALLIVVHALLLGADFIVLSRFVPQLFFAALFMLLFLQALRVDKEIRKISPQVPQLGIAVVVVLFATLFTYDVILSPHSGGGINVHAQHLQQAQQVLLQQAVNPTLAMRYTASFIPPQNAVSGQPVAISFQIFNADTGKQVTEFDQLYTKSLHLVIVDNGLKYFSHIHPDLLKGTFSAVVTFPHDDLYHLYINFQPSGGSEQQFGFSLPVGSASPSTFTENTTTQAIVNGGAFKVALQSQGAISAQDISSGLQYLNFHVTKKDGSEEKNLYPYLGSFAHLVMINTKTFQYVHVHPTQAAESQSSRGGPDITFLPLGLFGKITPGTYKLFLQLAPDNQLITANFIVNVEQ